MTIDHLFAAVFACQLLVVSLYVPGKILRRACALIATRPPAEYPKLYPVPVATIERVLRVWGGLCIALLFSGLALLAAAWAFGYTIDPVWAYGDIPAKNPMLAHWLFSMVQCAPIMLWAFWELSYFRRMRTAAQNEIRTAQLKPRRLFDFASPALLGTGAATYVGGAVLLLVLLSWEGRPRVQFAFQYMLTVTTLCNLCAAAVLVWMVRSKKMDPHQAHGDRVRMLRATAQTSVVMMILLNTFLGVMATLIAFRVLHFVPILVSLFVQVLAVLSTRKLGLVAPFGQEDFEGYRASTNRAGA